MAWAARLFMVFASGHSATTTVAFTSDTDASTGCAEDDAAAVELAVVSGTGFCAGDWDALQAANDVTLTTRETKASHAVLVLMRGS